MLFLEFKSIMWVDGIPISNFMCSEGRRKSREASPAVSTRSREEEIPLGSMNKGSSSRKSSQSSSSSSTTLHQQSSDTTTNGPSTAVANSSSSTSNTTQSSIQSTSHPHQQTPSKLTLNLKSSSSEDPQSTQQSNSITTTQVVTSNKDEEVTTPHLETSFISDVASDSGNASGNSVKSEEISSLDSVVPPPSPFQSSSHSSTNNGLANSVFVPKGKKKGVIETV